MIPAHTPATLTARVRRSPASLGSYHYYLEPGQAVRVLSATDTDARCYCGQPEDSRISEDYFTVPISSLQVAESPLDYPPKPENATHFQRHYSYEPATVLKWEWSTTFGRWGALVRFADGAEIYTYPRPEERPTVPALRIGAPVRVKRYPGQEQSPYTGQRGTLLEEHGDSWIVTLDTGINHAFYTEELTVLE